MPTSCCLIMKTIDVLFFFSALPKLWLHRAWIQGWVLLSIQVQMLKMVICWDKGEHIANSAPHIAHSDLEYSAQPRILSNDLWTFMIDVYKSSKGHFYASGVMNKTLYSKQQDSCLTRGEALCFWLNSPFHCETSQGEQLWNQDNKPGTSCCSRICLRVAKICFLHLWIWFSFVFRVLTVNTDTCAIFARSRAHLLVSSKTQCLLQKGKKKKIKPNPNLCNSCGADMSRA